MFMQFFYVQKKDNNEVFLYIIKYENSIENLNEKIYTTLYDTNNIKDTNYSSKFYLKHGFKINCNDFVWNQFLSIKLENLDLISLIDIKKINKYYNTDILHFNYNIEYKHFINSTITKLIINKDIIE
jgi:hypothetical protein